MGYYVRAFCTSGEPPAIGRVIEFARARSCILRLDPGVGQAGLEEPDWRQVAIRYGMDPLPILLGIDRDGDPLVGEEVEEFLGFLEDAPRNANRAKVERYLRETKFIVAAQLMDDIDEAGYRAVGSIFDYFVENNGGMVQADGEGFYDGRKLIVELN